MEQQSSMNINSKNFLSKISNLPVNPSHFDENVTPNQYLFPNDDIPSCLKSEPAKPVRYDPFDSKLPSLNSVKPHLNNSRPPLLSCPKISDWVPPRPTLLRHWNSNNPHFEKGPQFQQRPQAAIRYPPPILFSRPPPPLNSRKQSANTLNPPPAVHLTSAAPSHANLTVHSPFPPTARSSAEYPPLPFLPHSQSSSDPSHVFYSQPSLVSPPFSADPTPNPFTSANPTSADRSETNAAIFSTGPILQNLRNSKTDAVPTQVSHCINSTNIKTDDSNKSAEFSNTPASVQIPSPLELYAVPKNRSPCIKKVDALKRFHQPQVYHPEGFTYR